MAFLTKTSLFDGFCYKIYDFCSKVNLEFRESWTTSYFETGELVSLLSDLDKRAWIDLGEDEEEEIWDFEQKKREKQPS